jgi:ATP-dependent Lon protease
MTSMPVPTRPTPETLPILPLPEAMPLPGPARPLDLDEEEAGRWQPVLTGHLPRLALMPVDGDGFESMAWPATGALAVVRQALRLPQGGVRLFLQALHRARVERPVYLVGEPPRARVEALPDQLASDTEEQALAQHLASQWQRFVDLSGLPEPLKAAAREQQGSPGGLADLVASALPSLPLDVQRQLLDEVRVKVRLRTLATHLGQEVAVLEMGQQIQEQVRQEMGQHQREHMLREQMRAIQKELGGDEAEADSLRERVARARLPEEAQREAERELERLAQMAPGAAEASVARTYIDWILAIPWSRRSPERLELERARRVLEEDHEGLDKVKERILEYIAVRKLRGAKEGTRGPVLLLAGPPGVGKTSLGRSVARALGRRFERLSLGGVHDEAEIRGHRRTYVGAMPGRLVQALRKAGTNNPVIQLDEIDKVGADHRGDPSAALLEVLDPEQNHAFVDHYLDVPVDLSQVIFLATANQLDTIPPALRDRLEVLTLPGYSEEEKLRIARRHLLPRQWKAHGIGRRRIEIDEEALRRVVRGYTREAGLRNLERELATIARKLARRIVEGGRGPFRIGAAEVPLYLGPEKISGTEDLRADTESAPGLVAGLAWTPAGGEVMHIEASRMPGEGLRLTGQLGEVMKESAQIALSYVRAHAERYELPPGTLDGEIHVHLPAGAVPKDGPSAGVALTTALVSLLTGVPVRGDVAMTGEVTLRGRVLPVGGVQEKLLAARRAGLSTVFLPRRNERDLAELPEQVRADLEIRLVDDVTEVLDSALLAAPVAVPQRQAA